MTRRPSGLAAALLLGGMATSAVAFDTSVSGFGTLGYARSDQPFAYLRSIDRGGTLKRDSVLGLQLDTKLGNEWGFTIQGKVAAAAGSDQGVQGTVSWAFVSWRPTNDLLLRVGKFRAPLYLNSQTSDVGVTFDLARLPAEVYSQSPTDDFTGVAVAKTWNLGIGEVVLDAYGGDARTHLRSRFREGVPPIQPSGSDYLPMSIRLLGLAATLRRDDDTYRIAYNHAQVFSRSPALFPRAFPFVQLPGLPGVGYFQTLDGIPAGTVPMASELTVPVLTMGVELQTVHGVRLVGEYGRRIVRGSELGFNSAGAYLAAFRPTERWTPYLAIAALRSTKGNLGTYAALNNQRVPALVPMAATINALQRAGADSSPTFDQHSVAIGTAYALSSKAKLKAEWQHVRIGAVSALVDAPPGSDIRHQGMHIVSLSYSFVF